MKKIIAHRANLNGPNSAEENHPASIDRAIDQGFDVEVDLWFLDGKYFIGHDNPDHEINEDFLFD